MFYTKCVEELLGAFEECLGLVFTKEKKAQVLKDMLDGWDELPPKFISAKKLLKDYLPEDYFVMNALFCNAEDNKYMYTLSTVNVIDILISTLHIAKRYSNDLRGFGLPQNLTEHFASDIIYNPHIMKKGVFSTMQSKQSFVEFLRAFLVWRVLRGLFGAFGDILVSDGVFPFSKGWIFVGFCG